MRRRDLFAVLGGAAASWARGAVAQPKDRLRRLAIVTGSSPGTDFNVTALEDALRSLGWRKDDNLHIDYRKVDIVNQEAVDSAVKESVAADPEIIVAEYTPITRALLRATRTIPIVFVIVIDPVGSGFVESLGRPGGNVTGFVEIEPTIVGKWLQLLKEIAPGANRVGLLYNPDTTPGHGEIFFGPFNAAAQSLAVTAIRLSVHDVHDIETAMAGLADTPGGAVVVSSDSFLAGHFGEIIALAERLRLPTIASSGYQLGCLITYGANQADVFRRSASYVDRILKGEKPAELSVQQPTKFMLGINLKTAKELGLTVPPSLLAQADGVIE
jgi:putative ABC transport system substrate-binding protein